MSEDLAVQTKPKEKEFNNVVVTYVSDPKASKIMLPEGMSYKQARVWLVKIEEEQERTFSVHEEMRGWFPFDAMYALYRALTEEYGFTEVANFKGFWGKEDPPFSVSVEVSRGRHQQIPWGPLKVHGIDGGLKPSISMINSMPTLVLGGEFRNKDRAKVERIFASTRRILKESSIYRGQAIEVDFNVFGKMDQIDATRCPRFMDTNITESDLIVPRDVRALLETALWTPIRHTDLCRKHKIPLRRGILLAGKYGVGKTLASRVTAMLSERHAWTYIYIKNHNQMEQALAFAKNYEPCVIFVEDINRITSGSRDEEMDKIFNMIDGVDRKNDEVMVVFTTNDLDDIHEGMLRPGRVDTVITITPPDAEATERLMRYYGHGLISSDENISSVAEMLAGQIPAIIREAVERSKLAAISTSVNGTLVIHAEHLRIAAMQMLEHARLLEPKAEPKPDLQILGESIGRLIANGIHRSWARDDLGLSGKPEPDEDDDVEAARYAAKVMVDLAGRPEASNGSKGA